MKLKGCPFCGGKGRIREFEGMWMISCSNTCGVLMTGIAKNESLDLEKIKAEIKNAVIINWNKRV